MNFMLKPCNKYLLLSLILVFIQYGNVFAQLEIGAHLQIRNIKPAFGYGLNAEIGIPTDSDWRLAFRGYLSIFAQGVPEYAPVTDYRGNILENNKTGSPVKGFDRGIGMRIYYQTSEFQPYFGFGATYMYNDIISPDETPTIDYLERSLNYDFTGGFSYLLGDNLTMYLECHYANITRMTEFTYKSSLGVNVGLTFRFGRNKFAEYYEY
jgi:hypothetical protein